jgi:hypothetical protein
VSKRTISVDQKTPVLFSRSVPNRQPTGIAALFQPTTLATVPLTPTSQLGQLQAQFQITYNWELNPAAQLTEPQIAPELEPWLRLVDTIGEWIAEHPWETVGIGACASLLVVAAFSRN